MPLLLASTFQHFKKLDDFHGLLSSAKVACIVTAENPYIEKKGGRPDWAQAEIDAVCNRAETSFEYDLTNKKFEDLRQDLSECDLIYFIGGNTFYLLDQVNKSGFRDFAQPYLSTGKSIWGGSAGAIIHCPDINYIASMDEPEEVNLKSTKGLNFVDFYLMPHWKGGHHSEALECLAANPDISIICLTDDQAIYVEDNKIEIL